MARISLEERQERVLNKLLSRASKVLKDAGEDSVKEWLNNDLTLALVDAMDADLLKLQLDWSNGTMSKKQSELAQAKVQVFTQLKDYLESGHIWLEEIQLKREEEIENAKSDRQPRNSGTDESS